MTGTTPSQTVGPYLAHRAAVAGRARRRPGRARRGGSACTAASSTAPATPVPDALVETWQADPDGRFGTGFRGFGRCPTDEEGAGGSSRSSPAASTTSRRRTSTSPSSPAGCCTACVTRIYFADEPTTPPTRCSSRVPEARRATLLAERRDDDGYRFDMHLQGERETVFFAV